MRALRDFNIPKIVTDDTPVFMGLIGDLFPALDVPRKRDPEFEKYIRQGAVDLKLQPEESFILKVIVFLSSSTLVECIQFCSVHPHRHFCNIPNVEATFVQNTRMQIFLKNI